MTSISANFGNSYISPLQKLQQELQAEVNSGAISSADQSALSAALTNINSSLQSGPASSPGDASSSTGSSPGDLQSKIDNLIAAQVSSGQLTSSQATELQGVFKAAFANGAGGAHHHHHGGSGGPPPTDGSSAADSTNSTSSGNDLLQQFLQSLQNSLSGSSATPYSATGASDSGNNGSASFSALLINYQT
jgi:hypothetical protein